MTRVGLVMTSVHREPAIPFKYFLLSLMSTCTSKQQTSRDCKRQEWKRMKKTNNTLAANNETSCRQSPPAMQSQLNWSQCWEQSKRKFRAHYSRTVAQVALLQSVNTVVHCQRLLTHSNYPKIRKLCITHWCPNTYI